MSAPAFAHHSLAAEYDEKKPVTLKGTVTKFDWTNPHVFVFLDAADVTWAVEFPQPDRTEERRLDAGDRSISAQTS